MGGAGPPHLILFGGSIGGKAGKRSVAAGMSSSHGRGIQGMRLSADPTSSMLWRAAQQVIGWAQQSSRAAADRAILPAQLELAEAQNRRYIADSCGNCSLDLLREHLRAEVTRQRSGSRIHCAAAVPVSAGVRTTAGITCRTRLPACCIESRCCCCSCCGVVWLCCGLHRRSGSFLTAK